MYTDFVVRDERVDTSQTRFEGWKNVGCLLRNV